MEKSRSQVSGIKESLISPISPVPGRALLDYFIHFQPSHCKSNREKQTHNQMQRSEEMAN